MWISPNVTDFSRTNSRFLTDKARSTIGVAMDRRESVRSKRGDINDFFSSEAVRSDRSDLKDSSLSTRSARSEPVRSITPIFDKLVLEAPGVGLL